MSQTNAASGPGIDTKTNDAETNLVVRVVRGPAAELSAADFEVTEEDIPRPGDGEVLYRAIYMSLDAGMRSGMPLLDGRPGRPGGIAVGDPMFAGKLPPQNGWTGGLVGRVLESRHPAFVRGDFVHGGMYWQTHHVMAGEFLAKVDPAETSLVSTVGVLGQSSFTAWCGVTLVAKPKPGDVVVVSGAGGAVGMVAAQISRLRGATVIGIASGEKVRYLTDELGVDHCVDRLATPDIGSAIDELAPNGVDVYFDNVGGPIRDAMLPRLRKFGRLVVCGAASEYGAERAPATIDYTNILAKSLTIGGFVVYDHYDLHDQFWREMSEWIGAGDLRYRYQVIDGLENAAQGLVDLLAGCNEGKPIVQVSLDPTTVPPAESA
ncbi:NADP-dependent oxidoreductase [Micromonospora sp. NPDC005206]|uniref:NADP-dependent oxidoreductase n=1 Tax=Micromonospora sp. NPDC005206 TaxID=3157022 RepID=UPI0033AD6009